MDLLAQGRSGAELATQLQTLQDTQRATSNILEDFALEKRHFEQTQRAVFNILDDFAGEKSRLQEVQRATVNILEDLHYERDRFEAANGQLVAEIARRKRAEEEIRQLTEALQNRAARLEEANRELEAFSYSVSHDLRAPLRAIDGFSNAMLRFYKDKLDERGEHYLERLRAGSQRMSQLIDDLLNLSRISRVEVKRQPVDLSARARAIFAELQSRDPSRSVDLQIEEGLVVEADERLLLIALENLLGNAWKFTGKQPSARIELGRERGGPEPVFFVKDNGAGFEMAHVDKLFAPFQRLHDESEFEGTGIGLATIHRIVTRHGGRIWATSVVGQGATFFFTLGVR